MEVISKDNFEKLKSSINKNYKTVGELILPILEESDNNNGKVESSLDFDDSVQYSMLLMKVHYYLERANATMQDIEQILRSKQV